MNLIVGIDPGITTGLAMLNMKGELVSISSSKRYSQPEIIKELASNGKPLIIASDVHKTPDLILGVAGKFDAAVISPKDDLKRSIKERLVKPYGQEFNNYHERDALAAAINAYHQYESLINKVLKHSPKKLFEPLIRGLILKKVKNINEGLKRYKGHELNH